MLTVFVEPDQGGRGSQPDFPIELLSVAELPVAEIPSAAGALYHGISSTLWCKQLTFCFQGYSVLLLGYFILFLPCHSASGASRALERGSWKTVGINMLGPEVGVPALLVEPASQ